MKNITVFGATGMLGKPVVRELVAAGYKITAMVRSPEKAREVLPGSVNLIRGDLDSLPDIQNALENADGIYINLSVAQDSKTTDFQPEREGISNILAAAKDKNIQRIGYLSSLVQRYNGMNGFRWWAFDIKREALRNIKQSGIPYAIFYPSNFLEDLPEVYTDGNKFLVAGKSDVHYWWIAGSDYGKQVAKAFDILKPDENREYAVQGPEAFTVEEAAKIYLEIAAPQVKIIRTPLGLLKFLGIFSSKMSYVANISEALNKYPEQFESEKTWAELGKPAVTLREFAHEISAKQESAMA